MKQELKTKIQAYLLSQYDEFVLEERIEDAKPNYLGEGELEDHIDEEGEYNIYDAYAEYGHGEAEMEICNDVVNDIMKHFKINVTDYKDFQDVETYCEISYIAIEIYDCLDN